MAHYVYHNKAKKSSLRPLNRSVLERLGIFFFFVFFTFPATVLARVPNDPEVSQWSFTDVKAFDAWELATGSSEVVVAVIDNGFDTFHPELFDNVWKNEDEIPDNGRDDDNNGYIDDVWGWNFVGVDRNGDGAFTEEELSGNNDPRPDVLGITVAEIEDGSIHHGTLVAGLIGARGDNQRFGAGLNWNVKLMNVKVVGNSGNISIARIADAIRYAVDNGADVINISLIGPAGQEDLKEAIQYAYAEGVAVVAASGNDYLSLDLYPKYPICADEEGDAADEWILGVSAIDESHRLAQFANRGSCIDITAPGTHISSTLRYAPRFGLDKLYGGTFSGTSFAAPFVSATAALLKSIHPEWGPKEIFSTILSTVHKTPPVDELEYARYFGRGLIQIDKAVKAALAKIVSHHPLQSLVAYRKDTGALSEMSPKIAAGAIVVAQGAPPAGLKAVASFRDGAVSGFVGILQTAKNGNEAVVFDTAWRATNRFELPFRGAVSLAVGNVLNDSRPEIIVAAHDTSSVLFSIYSLIGEELRTVPTKDRHRGVSLGLVGTKDKPKDILAVFNARLHRFSQSFDIVQTIPLPSVQNTAPVSAGDIDGDGLQEYVVGSGALDAPTLAYFDEDGTWKRTFPAFDPGYAGGVQALVGDYDLDGKDDVIVAGNAGGVPIRVWTDRSKRIAEFWPFADGSRGNVLLVGRYR